MAAPTVTIKVPEYLAVELLKLAIGRVTDDDLPLVASELERVVRGRMGEGGVLGAPKEEV